MSESRILIESESAAIGMAQLAENVGLDNNGVLMPLLAVGTPLPAEAMQVMSTGSDEQSTIAIDLYRGNRMMAKDGTFLGRFAAAGFELAPAGIPQIGFCITVEGTSLWLSVTDERAGLPLRVEREFR
ncbi:MAG: Hsp70 family protein [Myxococcota bacterium]